MKRKNMTRNALFTSVLSLLLCVSMLVGTTFAWFTDSVTSGVNVIASGNLDVVLEYKTDWADEWQPVDQNTKIFKEGALYEPGYTEVVFLRVSNAGSLALKFDLAVNVSSEASSINVNDESFKLSDYLMAGAYVQDEFVAGANNADILMPTMFATRDAAKGYANTKLSEFKSLLSSDVEHVILPGEDTAQVAALVLTMPETVGNEANHKTGGAAPQITLGISLQATQVPHEVDSFDANYDKDATYDEVKLPMASVNNTGAITVPVYQAKEDLALDTSFQFQPNETAEEVAASPYKNWHADFVVKADKDVAAESLALAGYYEAYCSLIDNKWIALTSPDDIVANTEVRLVGSMNGITVSYEEICQYGNDGTGFKCGAADLGGNEGTTITVELRLYEVDETNSSLSGMDCETGEYIVIGTYNFTF